MQKIKQVLKAYILELLNLPYSKYGLPIPLIKHLKENRPITLIDLGVHDGGFTESVSRYCGINRAVLVEPLTEKMELLEAKFNDPKYLIINNAISDVRGTARFEVNKFAQTSSLLSINRDMPELSEVDTKLISTAECQTITLDDLFDMADLSSIDLLKIDVQGAEHLVVRGGKNALRRTKMVWTEVSFKPLYESSSTFIDIYHALQELGFKLMEISAGFRGPDGELLQADTLFERDSH